MSSEALSDSQTSTQLLYTAMAELQFQMRRLLWGAGQVSEVRLNNGHWEHVRGDNSRANDVAFISNKRLNNRVPDYLRFKPLEHYSERFNAPRRPLLDIYDEQENRDIRRYQPSEEASLQLYGAYQMLVSTNKDGFTFDKCTFKDLVSHLLCTGASEKDSPSLEPTDMQFEQLEEDEADASDNYIF